MSKKINILIVDDEKSIANGLCLMISRFNLDNVDCEYVTSVDAAMQRLAGTRADIVLTDINMPGKSGLDLLSALVDEDVKTVVVSGYDNFEYVRSAFSMGLVDYLLKPVDQNELKKLITALVAVCRLSKAEDLTIADNDKCVRVIIPGSRVGAGRLYCELLRKGIGNGSEFFEYNGRLALISAEENAIDVALAAVKSGIASYAVVGKTEQRKDYLFSLNNAEKFDYGFLRGEHSVVDCNKEILSDDALTAISLSEYFGNPPQLEKVKEVFEDDNLAGELKLALCHKLIEELNNCAATEETEKEIKIKDNPVQTVYELLNVLYEENDGGGGRDEKENGDGELKLKQIDEVIDSQIFNNPDMTTISNLLNQNYFYFSRKFSKIAGCSFSSYLENKKLEKAKELLLSSNMWVYAVAEKLGYYSVKYFVKVFKKKFGLSPNDFRTAHGIKW